MYTTNTCYLLLVVYAHYLIIHCSYCSTFKLIQLIQVILSDTDVCVCREDTGLYRENLPVRHIGDHIIIQDTIKQIYITKDTLKYVPNSVFTSDKLH